MRIHNTLALLVSGTLLGLALSLSGCSDNPDTPEELMQWLDTPENGLVSTKTIGDVQWKAKYIPNEYLAQRYLQSVGEYNTETRDSVIASYRNSICFMISVSFATPDKGDVIKKGVGSQQELEQRLMTLNFDVKKLLHLRYKGGEEPAVISVMENTHGLGDSRDVMVIFAKNERQWEESDTLTLVLDDRIFKTGIHNFSISKAQLENVPELDIPVTS